MEMHEGGTTTTTSGEAATGVPTERPDNYEPPVVDSV